MAIWCILSPLSSFGIFCGHLVLIFQLWYVGNTEKLGIPAENSGVSFPGI
jgi:hypothetical protein